MTYVLPLILHEILHNIVETSVKGESFDFAALESRIRATFDYEDVPTVWSRAVMIILHQRLRGIGMLHPTIRSLAWEILLELEPKPCLKHALFPLFLAGTVSIFQSQRTAVKARWVRAPEKGFDDGYSFLQILWDEMDRTGNTVDWLDFAREKKVVLAFF